MSSNSKIVGNFNIHLQLLTSRQETNNERFTLNKMLDQMNLTIFTEHFIQRQDNKHSCQDHMEHSTG